MKNFTEAEKLRQRKNIMRVWGKTYARCYWPNCYRFEMDDDEVGSYHIYINDEEVECCPRIWTEAQARDRFLELLEKNGIKYAETTYWKQID